MFDTIAGSLLIMGMRICDVSIGTMRTILIVQGKKYLAGMTGFFEVLIDAINTGWIKLDDVIPGLDNIKPDHVE